MRKFTFLLAFVAFASMSFAQTAALGYAESVEKTKQVLTKSGAKEAGEVYWSEDFDGAEWSGTVVSQDQGYEFDASATLPTGWAFKDNLGLDYYWHWSDVGPRGLFTSTGADCHVPNNDLIESLPEGTSTANGFMLFEADYYNTTEGCGMSSNLATHDSYMEYGPLDFSSKPGVIFNVKTMYRFCCSSPDETYIAVEISNDYVPGSNDGTWTTYRFNVTTATNNHTYSVERDFYANVSKTAMYENVYFRIKFMGGSHYYAMVDDVKFLEPEVMDLTMEDWWYDYMYDAEAEGYALTDAADNRFNFWGGYTQIPLSYVASFVDFRAAVLNNGTADVTNAQLTAEIYKEGEKVYETVSPGKDIASAERDSLRAEADYTPAALGHYQVSMTVGMDNDENDPSTNMFNNNHFNQYEFDVVTTRYSRVYHDKAADFYGAGPHDWSNGGNDGDVVAQRYSFEDTRTDKVTVKAVEVFVDYYDAGPSNDDELAAIANGNMAMIGKIWVYDETEDAVVDMGIQTEFYTIKTEDVGTWVTLEFVDNGNLVIDANKDYRVGVETYTGNSSLRFQVGTDGTISKTSGRLGFTYLTAVSNWYITWDNYAIDLIIESTTTDVALNFNVDMTDAEDFTAGTDKVYVTGSFAGEGDGWNEPGTGASLELTDTDGDMIYSGTASVAINQTVSYKYFKNAGWDGGEWAGDPNRTVEIAEADVTIDPADVWAIYDNINTEALEAISMYPNPFNNTLNIEGLEEGTTVIISNVVGQAVMTVSAENAATISTADLTSGVYMITFVDANNNMRTERIIKR